jgi:hypothetical protein
MLGTATIFFFAMVAVCKDRNAVDSHHLPEGTHSLAPRPGSLVWLTFHLNHPRPPPRSRNRKSEIRGRGRERRREGTKMACRAEARQSEGWSAWQDLHLQPFRLERNASSLGYTRCLRTATRAPGQTCTDTVRGLNPPPLRWATGAKWCRVRDFHPQPLRSERSASCSWATAA